MQAVLPAGGSHDLLANAHTRGRHRSASDAYPPAQREPEQAQPEQLPKAASYTYFPRVKDLDEPLSGGLDGRLSQEGAKNGVPYPSSEGSSPDSEEGPPAEQMPQLKPAPSRRTSRFLSFSSRGSKSRDPSQEPQPRTGRHEIRKQSSSPGLSPARSLSKLRRKSWVAPQSSRPGSPAKLAAIEEPAKDAEPEMPQRTPAVPAPSIPKQSSEKPRAAEVPHKDSPVKQGAKGRVLTKKPKRPLSTLFNSSSNQQTPDASHGVPAVPKIPKSFSTDKLPYNPHSPSANSHIPPLPRDTSSDKLKGAKTEHRKRDELWTVFRTLEGDLRKFQSKSIALKTNVVRTTLLPFLRTYVAHPSNQRLRPEDLDRRANILNGWWTGLLELIAGRNNQSISGTDRPAILDGIAGVMERPEWRMAPSPFCALADRVETGSTTTMETAGSNSSTSSDFLSESVYHNVRNIFTQNLLSQMSFVVDKMSLRSAPASLVTFCGKTCAYAFCFCPGVADLLVRLWNPSLDLLKRVLEEYGVSRQDRLDDVSERVVAAFPPMLHSLKFSSLAKAVRLLRKPAAPPLGTANLDWSGPWLKRWSGAESDLFYVFVKHYHILVTDFLPMEPSNVERLCVPGLVMVHAQVLVNMDATINRHGTVQQSEGPSTGALDVTFDDVLSDPDVTASTLPIPPANATRQMAENRLIMLIRDFLCERNAHLHIARRVFADSFGCLLKAAARRVSIYDNGACYTLCDFLEEAFIILVRYEQLSQESVRHSVLDWDFWLGVCKSMAASHNTATEIKLYAFLYSCWSIIAADDARKTSLCLDFLLEPEFFETRFNHWCPMVRSYFMRLICWRVARFDGDDTVCETNIIKALSDRLRSVWAHYLWVLEESEQGRAPFPSTQACNPAPGRRFLIIRNDNPIATNAGPFVSFDGVMQSPNSRRLSSTTNHLIEPSARPLSAQSEDSDFAEEEPTKGRWNMLRSFISSSKASSKLKGSAASKSDKDSSSKASTTSTSTLSDSSAPAVVPKPTSSQAAESQSNPTPPHRSFSFRFSLEWVDKRFGGYPHMRLAPPRLPLAAQVHLQTKCLNNTPVESARPTGIVAENARYAGRALAEWTFISHECQNFFDRRKNEGVPSNRLVETPTLAVETFRRPG